MREIQRLQISVRTSIFFLVHISCTKSKCVENVFGENVLNGNIYQMVVYDFEVLWVSLFVEYGMLEIIVVLTCEYVLYKLNFSSNTWSSASNRNNETPFCLTILIN